MIKSYCKVNLFLKILSKNNKGLHNIQSTVMLLDLYDEIIRHREKFVKIRGINYSYHHPLNLNPIPPGDDFKKWEEDLFYIDNVLKI